ncbi:MAG: DUF1189 family protein [Elusimicrobiota bacterium]
MLLDPFRAVLDFRFYREVPKKSGLATVGYISLLGLAYALSMLLAVHIHLRPLINEAVDWLATSVPVLTLADGKISCAMPGPIEIRPPRLPNMLLVIDTERTAAVSPSEMTERKIQAYLTQNTAYIYNPSNRRVEAYDLAAAKPPAPMVIDGPFYRKIGKLFTKALYPATLAIAWFFFFVAGHFWALVYSLVALLVNAFMGAEQPYSSLYKISVYAQTPVVVLQVLTLVLWKPIPYYRLLALVIVGLYLCLAIRQIRIEAPEIEGPVAS